MDQEETSESLLNFVTTYVLWGALVFATMFITYKLWLGQPDIAGNLVLEQSYIKAEEESLKTDSLDPEFIINEGDTLSSILDEANINSTTASAIVDAFSKKYNPRKLNIGTVIEFHFDKQNDNTKSFNNMVVSINNTKKVSVTANGANKFVATEVVIPLVRQIEHKYGSIKNSFIGTALGLSIPSNAIMSMIRAFSYDVDFQRDIKHGDQLEVIMEKFYTEDGKLSHIGNILYSGLTLSGKKISIYHFTHPDGQVAYYNEKGESIKKEFLRTPINAAKISSKFGMRNHPVLGYTRMHKGVDFAAPVGTPILAAGSGTIAAATRFGGYGKYIRIKHNAQYSTVYGHASRFAKGIKPGVKVTQGQVIAYVGMTGVTSGPHLHYEVLENGKQINPLKFKFASNSEKLTGKLLESFKKNKKDIDKQLVATNQG